MFLVFFDFVMVFQWFYFGALDYFGFFGFCNGFQSLCLVSLWLSVLMETQTGTLTGRQTGKQGIRVGIAKILSNYFQRVGTRDTHGFRKGLPNGIQNFSYGPS